MAMVGLHPIPPQVEVPTEIWIFIASYLTSTDLARLCRTSTQHLSVARPILYKSVNLPAVESTFKTFSLLSSNTYLAEEVLELIIRPPGFEYEPNLLEALLEILPLLTNMKKFSIVDSMIFSQCEERFLEIMKEKNPPLEEFSFLESTKKMMIYWEEDGDDLSTFTGLKKISWYIYNVRWALSNKTLRRALSASIETLESIALDVRSQDYGFLWQMRFPVLKRLDFGSVPTSWGVGELGSLCDFLNAHPGIEELRIGPYRKLIMDRDEFWEALTARSNNISYDTFRDPLVALRSYTGSVEGFFFLLTSNPNRYLTDSLEELDFELGVKYSRLRGFGGKIEILNKVFRKSIEVSGKLNLKRLGFPLLPSLLTTRLNDGLPFRDTTLLDDGLPFCGTTLPDDSLEIALLCAPSLEYYRGPIPTSYDELLFFLVSFPNLKQLYVCAHHVWGGRGDRLKENEREKEIAEVCESLEKIVVVSDDSDYGVICWKEVVRTKPGNEVLRIETYYQSQVF